ncbi:TolC family protein [Glacieibacterium sp.]|uniref:TolC family protein n=1 Tax=Glacieibacterium sp. TaxID=2860237 RepID=UPI003B0063A7
MLLRSILLSVLIAAPALAASDDPRHLMPVERPRLTAGAACGEAIPATPLALPDLVDLALCRNPATAAAWASVRSAAAGVGIARAADLPTLNASVGPQLSRSDLFSNSTVLIAPGQSFSTASSSTDLGTTASISLDWLIFDFGGRRARIDSARAQQAAALASFADTAQGIALDTVTAFNSVQANTGSVIAAEASVVFAQQSLNTAAARERSGVTTPSDTLQARSSLAQAELTLTQARGNLRTSQGQLAVVIGLPPTTGLNLAPPPALGSSDLLKTNVDSLIADAERLRPDLASQRAQLQSADANVRAARSDLRPTIGASAQNSLSYANSSNDRNSASVGVSLNIPLFNGYARTYQVTQAVAQRDRQSALTEQTRQQAGLDVFSNYTALDTAIRSLATARELISSSIAAANIAQGRYQAGVGTFTDLLNAQSQLASARQQLVQADFNVRTGQAQLARAVGGIGAEVDSTRTGR